MDPGADQGDPRNKIRAWALSLPELGPKRAASQDASLSRAEIAGMRGCCCLRTEGGGWENPERKNSLIGCWRAQGVQSTARTKQALKCPAVPTAQREPTLQLGTEQRDKAQGSHTQPHIYPSKPLSSFEEPKQWLSQSPRT